MKHAIKIIIWIFLTMKATILYIYGIHFSDFFQSLFFLKDLKKSLLELIFCKDPNLAELQHQSQTAETFKFNLISFSTSFKAFKILLRNVLLFFCYKLSQIKKNKYHIQKVSQKKIHTGFCSIFIRMFMYLCIDQNVINFSIKYFLLLIYSVF